MRLLKASVCRSLDLFRVSSMQHQTLNVYYWQTCLPLKTKSERKNIFWKPYQKLIATNMYVADRYAQDLKTNGASRFDFEILIYGGG